MLYWLCCYPVLTQTVHLVPTAPVIVMSCVFLFQRRSVWIILFLFWPTLITAHVCPIPLGDTHYPWNYFSHIITSSGLGCAFLWGWNTSGLLVSLLSTPKLGIKILFHTCPQSLVNVHWCYGRHMGKIWAKPRSQPSRSSQCSGRGQIAEELEKGAMAGKEMLLTGSSAWLEVVKAWRSKTLNWAAVGIGWGAPWHAVEWRD